MSRIVGLTLAMALFLSACIPGVSLPGLTGNPPADAQATESVLAATLAVETLKALPTATQPLADTPVPTVTLTKTVTPAPTLSQTPTVSATPSGTPATDTATVTVTDTLLPTGTPASGTPASPTATETLHPRFFGTQPPAISYGKIVLLNKSKREVYVSLQCTTLDGNKSILEYPVGGKMRISAPAGRYVYVAWVGGRKFEGWFNLAKNGEISITFEKNKVKVH